MMNPTEKAVLLARIGQEAADDLRMLLRTAGLTHDDADRAVQAMELDNGEAAAAFVASLYLLRVQMQVVADGNAGIAAIEEYRRLKQEQEEFIERQREVCPEGLNVWQHISSMRNAIDILQARLKEVSPGEPR